MVTHGAGTYGSRDVHANPNQHVNTLADRHADANYQPDQHSHLYADRHQDSDRHTDRNHDVSPLPAAYCALAKGDLDQPDDSPY